MQHSSSSSKPPSKHYKATLNRDRVMPSETTIAQQTPSGLYPVLISFTVSGCILRYYCGHRTPSGECMATCNPTETLPILSCQNKKGTPDQHFDWDMKCATS